MSGEFVPNHGRRPGNAKGKRMRVKLRGEGDEPYEPVYASDQNNQLKLGWAADDARWSHMPEGDPRRRFDIMEYMLYR